MRQAKVFFLLAAVLAGLAGFAATASATQVTAPKGTLYTGSISASNTSSITIHGVTDATCLESSLAFANSAHGIALTAGGFASSLTFTSCSQHVKVLKPGFFEVHASGRVESYETEFTVSFTTIFGNIHCVFRTNSTGLGNILDASSNEGHASWNLSGVIPIVSGSGLCGSSASITGSYKITSPTGLDID